jgi:hypothetical protein
LNIFRLEEQVQNEIKEKNQHMQLLENQEQDSLNKVKILEERLQKEI